MAFCVITALQTIGKIEDKMCSPRKEKHRMNIFFQSLTKINEMATHTNVCPWKAGVRFHPLSSSPVSQCCDFV